MRELRDFKQIICDASHDLTDLCVGIIGIAQSLQMVKGVLTHIRLNIHTHDMSHIRHKILRRRIDQTQYEIERRQLEHQRDRERRQICHGKIRDRAQDERQHHVAQTGERRAEQIQIHRLSIFF